MNTELLREIAKLIQERPREFDMRHWNKTTHCGTTHCIGGWAQHLTGKDDAWKALGLTEEEGDRLFYVYLYGRFQWPKRFLGRKKKDLSPRSSQWRPTAEQAAARIEHFIATEGRE